MEKNNGFKKIGLDFFRRRTKKALTEQQISGEDVKGSLDFLKLVLCEKTPEEYNAIVEEIKKGTSIKSILKKKSDHSFTDISIEDAEK